MKIAVIGAGAVGTYFGARLAAAGEEVSFLARGRQLEALRNRGLRIESPAGNLRLLEVRAAGSCAEIGVADLALVCVKSWQVPEIARTMGPVVGPRTALLPFQNGVEAAGQLAAEFGWRRVLGGVCRIIALVESPGVTRHVGGEPLVGLGEFAAGAEGRLAAATHAFRRSGIRTENPPDITAAIWEKFLFIAAVGGVGSVARAPLGAVRERPETRAMLEGAMREVLAVAVARGVRLDAGAVERTLAFLDTLPADGTSSMQRDIAEGRPSELESLSGAVVRLGKESGVPTPIHAFIQGSLVPQELAARGGPGGGGPA